MSGNFMVDTRIGFGKRETTPGDAVALVAADFVARIRGLEIADLTIPLDDESSKPVTGDHTKDEGIPGMETMGANFNWRIAQGEMTGPTPFTLEKLPLADHIEACGNSVTFEDVGGSWLIAPGVDEDNNTETFGVYDKNTKTGNGTEILMAGAMGNLKIASDGTKKPFIMSVELKGKIESVTDIPKVELDLLVLQQAGMIDTIALTNSNTIIRVTRLDNKGADFLPADTHDFCASTVTFDQGNVIEMLECQEDNSGVEHFARFQSGPTIEINPMLEEQADWAWYDALTQVRFYRFELIKYVDSTKTDKAMEIILPNTQLVAPGVTVDGNKFRNNLKFRALRNKAGASQAERERDFTIQLWGQDIA